MNISEKFNKSGFSRWINGGYGMSFRFIAGLCFLFIGIIFRHIPFGIAAILWSFFPLTAGIFDVCYISAVLGGPFSGKTIRKQQSELKRII